MVTFGVMGFIVYRFQGSEVESYKRFLPGGESVSGGDERKGRYETRGVECNGGVLRRKSGGRFHPGAYLGQDLYSRVTRGSVPSAPGKRRGTSPRSRKENLSGLDPSRENGGG